MTDYGPQDTSTTTLGANQFPISEDWTPNVGFSAVEGGPQTTDSGGKKSAPVSMYVKDGSDVTQGLQADTTWSGSGAGSVVAILKKIVAGQTGTATVVQGAGASAGTNWRIAGDFTEQAALSAGALNADLVPSFDVSGFRFATLHILPNAYVGTLTLQGSNDGTNFIAISGYNLTTPQYVSFSSTWTTNGVIVGIPLNFRYLRVRMTTYTSGTAQAALELYTLPPGPYPLVAYGASQQGTWTVQPGNTANTTAWKVDGSGVTQPVSGTVTANTASVGTDGSAIPASSTLMGASDGTNLQQLLVESASNRNLRAGIYNGTNELAIDASGRITLVPNQAVELGDGTNLGNVLAATSASNALANQGAILAAGADKEVSFTTTTAQVVGSTDATNYRQVCVQINTQGSSSTVTFQTSNDNTNWASTLLLAAGSSNTAPVASTTTTGIWYGPVVGRYFRLNVTGIASGTTAGVIEFHTLANAPTSIGAGVNAAQAGTWTVQPGNTANTTPWLVAGPNANGVQAANSAANTVIKGTPGWLYHAIVTTLGTAALTIYDNATTNSGTPLLVIPASAAVGTIYSFPSGARAVNGITSAGVTNCPAVTFHYT